MIVSKWTRKEIKALRKAALRQTQERFSEFAEYSVCSIGKWENAASGFCLTGKAAAKMDELLRGLDPDQLARFTDALNSESSTQAVTMGDSLDTGNAHHRHTDAVSEQDLPARDGADSVNRQNFVHLLIGSLTGAALNRTPLAATSTAASSGTHIGLSDVARLRRQSIRLAMEDHRVGGELSAPDAIARLAVATSHAHATFGRDSVRRAYLAALAEFADTTAGVCFDAGLHREAEAAFAQSVNYAVEAEDIAMRAKALTGLANLAVHENRSEEALTYAEMALVRSDLLPARLRAVVYTRHARALGAIGHARGPECVAAVQRAEDVYSVDDDRTPPWLEYYDHAHLRRDKGRALLYLAINGGEGFDTAYQQLDDAVTGFRGGYSRGKALAFANLATLVMAREDPHHAVEIGLCALDSIGMVRSARVNHAFAQLAVQSRRHAGLPAVAALQIKIGETAGIAR